ncbi:MAG: potassium channel family protein [Candidatus Micrarchaeia archaeon]
MSKIFQTDIALTKHYLLFMFIALVAIVSFSFIELFIIFHGDFFTSLYYVLTYFFDAEGVFPKYAVAPLTSNFPIFVLLLLLTGIARITVIGFLIAIIIDVLSSRDIRKILSKIEVKHMSNHVIICGYSKFSDEIAAELSRRLMDFVIIEGNKVAADTARDLGYTIIEGDFKYEIYLKTAMINTARYIIFTSDDDFENILGLISAKKLSPKVKAIVKANDENLVPKMFRAGANVCIVPEAVAGIYIGEEIITHIGGN